jgi:hypothetical protein
MKWIRTFAAWSWGAGAVAALACSSPLNLPPEEPNCNGHDGSVCTVSPVGGGGAPSGGSSGGDSGTSSGVTTTTGSCDNAAASVNATSPNCQACIESGDGAADGLGCCNAAAACLVTNSACVSILNCVTTMCSLNAGGTCISGCISDFPSGAAAYDDFTSCLAQNCSSCPNLTAAVASEQ